MNVNCIYLPAEKVDCSINHRDAKYVEYKIYKSMNDGVFEYHDRFSKDLEMNLPKFSLEKCAAIIAWAADRGDIKLIDYIIENKNNVSLELGKNSAGGTTPLSHAVGALIKHERKKSKKNDPRNMVLSKLSRDVVSKLKTAAIKRLIQHGANVNAFFMRGSVQPMTSLDLALRKNHLPLVRMLIANGAKAHAVFNQKELRGVKRKLNKVFEPIVKRVNLLSLGVSASPFYWLPSDLVNVISKVLLEVYCDGNRLITKGEF